MTDPSTDELETFFADRPGTCLERASQPAIPRRASEPRCRHTEGVICGCHGRSVAMR